MRAVAGLLAFAVVLAAAVALLRMLATPPPPEGDRTLEVASTDELRYSCVVCGMEVSVLLKPKGEVDPPRHCGEPMELREETG